MYVASPPRHIHTQNVNLNTTLPMVYTLTRKKKNTKTKSGNFWTKQKTTKI